MCKFHKDVAQKVAMDPATGQSHIGYETVIRIALSRYWVERYISGADSVTGYSVYPMAMAKQQEAFEQSGLKKPLEQVQREEEEEIALLRDRLAALEAQHDLSPKALRLPIPTSREAFTEMTIDKFYKGDPRGDFRLIDHVDDENLQPLHRAVSFFQNDPEIEPVLERLIKGKICALYTEAPQKVNRDLVAAYERLPERVRDVGASLSRYGGAIALGGFSGLIGHSVHYASVLGAGLVAGTASSFSLALSGVFLLASYGGWNFAFGGRFMNLKQQASALAVQAGLTVAVMAGAQIILPHNHMNMEKMRLYTLMTEKQQQDYLQTAQTIYDQLPAELQKKVESEAEREGILPALYIQTCDGSSEVSGEVTAFLTGKARQSGPESGAAPISLAIAP